MAEFSDVFAEGHAGVHFSQLGEDVVLWHMLQTVQGGFYVDIGAHHPRRYSNTYLLHRFRAWRGMNVDADPRAIEAFQAERPSDINICAAVSDEEMELSLTLFEDGAVNSLDPALAQHHMKHFAHRETKTVKTKTLASLLGQLPQGVEIDLLTVDVEGLDERVLRSSDWSRFRPKVVCVEDHHFDAPSMQSNSLFNFLLSMKYRLVAHVFATSIYQSTV